MRRSPSIGGRRRVGVEHEFQLFAHGRQIDARGLLAALDIDGARLDPSDPSAVRCRWGGVITADGKEAEIATPPACLGRDGLRTAIGLADAGEGAVRSALPAGVICHGYSTHLNVEIEERRGLPAAHLVATRMAPAVMLLLDRRDSPGLLVRPRHRRLEFGGEYQRGDALLAALTIAAGITVLAERASGRARRALPPELAIKIAKAPQRFGWYIDRRAGGDDLYSTGRASVFRTRAGRTITAQQVLEATWACARPLLAALAGDDAFGVVDDAVSGRSPLPCELQATTAFTIPAAPAPPPDPALIDTRRRGDISISTVAATWHAIALRAEAGGIVRWIRVPGEHAEAFVADLDSGRLDSWLHAKLAGAPS